MIPKKVILQLASVCLLLVGTSQLAHAGFLTTPQAQAVLQRQALLGEVQSRLAAEDVRTALLQLGVSEAEVAERVAMLTDAELARVHERLGELPAGSGVVEIIGLTFIVLLILELVGVINIFNSF